MPQTLVQTVGKTHVWRSLGTADHAEAARRSRIVAGDIERSFLERDASLAAGAQGRLPIATAVAPTGPTVDAALARFLEDPARTRAAKTGAHYANLRVLMSDLWGADARLATVSRDDCRNLLDALRILPSNAGKRWPRLNLQQVLVKAKNGKAGPAMNPATVNGYMSKLRALMNYAVNEGWIDRNPARGLVVVDPVRPKDKRLPFSADQLRLIFSAPLYTGCQDDGHRYAVPGDASPRRGRFWIPLLALFAGLRLNEACQLEVTDVATLEGVTCLSISLRSACGEWKRLKTTSSERIVPLHPELTRIGFEAFVETRRRAGNVLLFDELPRGSTGYSSDPYSKWFRRFLAKSGASAARTCFHSFRHCFRDALRESDVRQEIALALGGWKSGEGTDPEAAYGRGFSAASLAEAMAKVTFPVDLSHLSAIE